MRARAALLSHARQMCSKRVKQHRECSDLWTDLPRWQNGRRLRRSAPSRRARRRGRATAPQHLCDVCAAVPRPVASAGLPWCPLACSGPAGGARWPRARPSATSRRSTTWRSWPRPFPPRSAHRAAARRGFQACTGLAGGAHLLRTSDLRGNLPQVGAADLRLLNFSQDATQVGRDFPAP